MNVTYWPKDGRVRWVGGAYSRTFGKLGTIVDVDREDQNETYRVKFDGETDPFGSWVKNNDIELVAQEPETPAGPPQVPAEGLTSADLAKYVSSLIVAVEGRITGVGADQYVKDGRQQFEAMPLAALIQYAREEMQDSIAYAAMMDIRLAWLQDSLRKAVEAAL